jgi:hypothetical protein
MFSQFASSLFGIGLGLAILLIVILVAVLVFEVWMFVNAILNKDLSDTRKLLWVVGMLFIHPFVAIAYYFTDYQKTV